jgi:hypothetical protein
VRPTRSLIAAAALAAAAALLPGTLSVWIDEEGHTYLTDGSAPPSAGARRMDPEELSLAWDGEVLGEPLLGESESSQDRYLRELRAARQDLHLGELQSALRRLRRLSRTHPERPEAPWLLVQVERSRGRLEAARAILASMLSLATPLDDRWRSAADRMLVELDEELELASNRGGVREARLTAKSENFYLHYDHEFAGRAYGEHVTELLEAARLGARSTLGRTLARPLDVFIYTRGHYLDAYEHRFGFATVGFYDGAIHAVSSRQPEADLLALLAHEYAHAVFQESLGSHRPFFLNEGIADREEERLRGRPRLAREEWRRLLDAVRSDDWIPLSQLVAGFGSLEGRRALLAYLESRATVELLEERSPGIIARWLARCAGGAPWEAALEAESGADTDGLDAALRHAVRDRFPADPLLGPSSSH